MSSKGREFVFNHQSHHKPAYDLLEGSKEWAGRWELHRYDMTWWRPQYYYFRSAISGNVEQCCQLGRGPMVRPGPLRDIVHLDVPHAVLRSHPNTPNALPEDLEGMWADTNPAWPEATVDHVLKELGLRAVWGKSGATEEYVLVPNFVDGINPEEAEPFDQDPLPMSATQIYARPAQLSVSVAL